MIRLRAMLSLALFSEACGVNSPRPRFPAEAERLLAQFAAESPTPAAYNDLFRYFLIGFLTYRDADGAGARFPGLPSTHGVRVDRMEGFTRIAPLVAVWLHSGRARRVTVPGRDSVDLVALIRDGMLAGTDSASPGYWAPVGDHDQRWVEAADVALSLWLTRPLIWERLTPAERGRIGRWLSSGDHAKVSNNNWHLFSTFVPLVLSDLGVPSDTAAAGAHYRRFKSFYRGGGWFSDGPGDTYDYYNAWGMHYLLYWIAQVRPDWDPAFIASSRRQFVGGYRHLIARNGVPIRGRSICYRLSAPAPLLLEYAVDRDSLPVMAAGAARRALDLTWSWFIRNRAVRHGTISQGYCGADPRVLDNYSGPASCLWSLRSLIAAFVIDARDPFWTGPPAPLPIDGPDYRVRIAAIGWTVLGDRRTGTIAIVADDSLPDSAVVLSSESIGSRFKTLLTGRAHRPRNDAAKYGSGTYRSSPPFCGCR